jgi:membrane-bound lytic murein transglycosylase MltF
MRGLSQFRGRLTVCVVSWVVGLTGIAPVAQAPPAQPKAPPAQAPDAKTPEAQKASALTVTIAKWTGDFDGMVKRRRIRILTPYSRTHYFIDKGVQRGVVYDSGMLLEQTINKDLKTTPATKVHVVFVPTSRDGLYQALVEGRGDIIAAGVIVTPERAKLVDFTVPGRTKVNQVLVTGPGAPSVSSLTDLSGKPVAVRDKSIQYESLVALNAQLQGQGKPAVTIKTVPPSLEDEDILEMVNSGLLKAAVTDEMIALFWNQVLPGLTVRSDIVVRGEGDVAWAVRKGSPKLLAVLNPFVTAHKEGTLFGNELLRRYLKSTKFVKSATSDAELQKFKSLMAIFEKYGKQYNLDYLLMMAQGYQESQLNQNAKSQVGAIGVMQVMPATGKELKVGDVHQLESNVHAGVKYIRFMVDQYFKDEPMTRLNKGLVAFAAYNCGPGRLSQLRREAKNQGLDPNVWFNNVERIAEKRIGRETVQYVSNIYKYYIAYTLTVDEWKEKPAQAR